MTESFLIEDGKTYEFDDRFLDRIGYLREDIFLENCFRERELLYGKEIKIEKENKNMSEKKETVNHPNHYGGGENPYEAIKIIEAYELNFSEGNALKYLLRYKTKNGIEDLKKAKWYIDRLIKKHPDNISETVESVVELTPKEKLKESFVEGIVTNTSFKNDVASVVADSVISGLEKFEIFPPKPVESDGIVEEENDLEKSLNPSEIIDLPKLIVKSNTNPINESDGK